MFQKRMRFWKKGTMCKINRNSNLLNFRCLCRYLPIIKDAEDHGRKPVAESVPSEGWKLCEN